MSRVNTIHVAVISVGPSAHSLSYGISSLYLCFYPISVILLFSLLMIPLLLFSYHYFTKLTFFFFWPLYNTERPLHLHSSPLHYTVFLSSQFPLYQAKFTNSLTRSLLLLIYALSSANLQPFISSFLPSVVSATNLKNGS